ncbi:MAG: CPBP family intramembrane metalloprotease [Anaerolineae bacterium]|nr:MAG: CPBP family intramembrane metalloprotease [Anaerolineae bacterium]
MKWIKRIFLSPDEPRLRAGWRLLLHTVMLFLLLGGAQFLVFPQLQSLHGEPLFFALQVVQLIAFTLSVYLARRLLDRRSFVSLGLAADREMWRELGLGILITGVMMGLIYLLEWAAGWLTFQGFAWQFDAPAQVWRGVGWMALIFLLVGWSEELLSRGYHLQTIASGLNMTWGVVLSASVFGLLHLGNPNATWVSAAGIFLAGVFLAYGYVRTGRLWLPIGLHIGWNFFEGVVFGFPVSGLDIYRLTRITVNGPELFTGGAFGPEAGLIQLPSMALGFFLIWWITRRRAEGDKE